MQYYGTVPCPCGHPKEAHRVSVRIDEPDPGDSVTILVCDGCGGAVEAADLHTED